MRPRADADILASAERPATITDLAAEIRASGHDFDSFQRTVGIDRSLLDSLVYRELLGLSARKVLREFGGVGR